MATEESERTAREAQRQAESFPFERELREQHDALRAFVRWLEAELERPGALDVLALLETFGVELARHFRFEEENGLADAFGSRVPEIRRWGAELVRQHVVLGERLCEIRRCAEAARANGAGRSLDPDIAEFCTALRRHDTEENAFLLWYSRLGAPPAAG
jgi:hemerythrin HHE cation binding domain-containing protein